MSVSAFIPVFNEEQRIEIALRNLQWCDEIILLDKLSTDRTKEIAVKWNAKIFTMPNTPGYDASEFEFMINHCASEWIFIFTASDVIHPQLALTIKDLTSRETFEYDLIQVPYRRYVMGIESRKSPWYTSHAPMVYRKSVVKINAKEVHSAIGTTNARQYTIPNSEKYCIFHLTHARVDGMMDRHLRYWRGEAKGATHSDLKKSFNSVIKSSAKVVLRGTFMLGWKGIALAFAFISYYMMSFVYRWESLYSDAPAEYQRIREGILEEWEMSAKKR